MNPGQGFARRVTVENLANFAPLLRRPAEQDVPEDVANQPSDTPSDPAYQEAERQFNGSHLSFQLPFRRPATTRRPRRRQPASAQQPRLQRSPEGPRGPLVWRKTLKASDVQRQPGNPTGGLRLTQARFTDVNGSRIDQTTYFRQDLFGTFNWIEGRSGRNRREDAFIEFDIYVGGEAWGVHRLRVSHKPSGEG
jgi:hypothetical protein